jgi:hypothetical protein
MKIEKEILASALPPMQLQSLLQGDTARTVQNFSFLGNTLCLDLKTLRPRAAKVAQVV